MSLAKYLARAGALAGEHKDLLAGLGGGAAVVGGGMAAQPLIRDYAANAAMDKIANEAQRDVSDTIDFAQEHPYITSAALGGSSLLGGLIGGDDDAGGGGAQIPAIQFLNTISGRQSQSGGGGAPRRRRKR